MKTIVVCALFFLSLIQAAAFAAEVILEFHAPTTNDDGSPIKYLDKGNGKADFKIYWGSENGGPYESTVPVEGNAVGTTRYRVSGLTPGKQCFVVTAITTFGMESDYSNEACKMLVPDTGSLQMLSPNGGEMASAGSYYIIYWQDPMGASKYKLKYSIDNGVTWQELAPGFLTDTIYDWLVPIPTKNKRACLVKIIGYNDNSAKIATDVSDAPFTIEVATITGPTLSEYVAAGTLAYPISWTTNTVNGTIASSTLSYTFNGGLTWKTIGNTSGNPGVYLWDIPNVQRIKKKSRIKLLLRDTSGKVIAKAFSNYFTVQP
jgi:hypothetical protein